MMQVDVRPLNASDRASWDWLWSGYLRFYQTVIEPDVRDVTFERLTNGMEPMGAFIAHDADGQAVGLVHWIMHRSCWTTGNYCYLQDLFVADGVRGGGVGRALIEAVYARAASDGCSRVHWLTQHTNIEAMKLYDRIADRSGFVQYRKMI